MTKRDIQTRWTTAGKWARFKELREQFKREGTPAADAWQIANDALEREVTAGASEANAIPPAIPLTEVVSPATDGQPPVTGLPPVIGRGAVDVSIFADKRCSEKRAVQWAAEHLKAKDVRPEDAPSAIAWTLLC